MQFIKWNLIYLAFAKYVCRLHNIKIYQNHSNHLTRGCQYPLFYVVFTRNETKIIQNKSHISHKTSQHVSDILWQHFCLISLHYYSLSFLLKKKTQENVFRKKKKCFGTYPTCPWWWYSSLLLKNRVVLVPKKEKHEEKYSTTNTKKQQHRLRHEQHNILSWIVLHSLHFFEPL